MGRRSSLVLFMVFAVVLFATINPTCSAQGAERGTRIVSPYDKVRPEIVESPLSIEDLTLDWFDYPVTSGSGTFTPIFLPFAYSSDVKNPDPNQAYAFPHLLSFKVDWVPGNACSRHPFFVFKREADMLSKLKGASPKVVARFVDSWSGTHGIGGELRETAEGWSGAMTVCDIRDASLVVRKYEEPRPYFRLMADMALDMFALMKQPVSTELKAEIEKDFTKHPKALRLLGEAAKAEERSNREWALYDKILALDPNFAEVRYWYANQKAWQTGDDAAGWKGRTEALSSRVVIPVLREWPSEQVADENTWTAYTHAVNRATALSPDNPFFALAHARLGRRLRTPSRIPLEDLSRLELVGRQYPGCGPLLREMARNYNYHAYPEKSIPLALSEVRSGFLHGMGGHADTWHIAGYAYGSHVGDWRRAQYCAKRGMSDVPPRYLRPHLLQLQAQSYHELCDFRVAQRIYETAYKFSPNTSLLVDWVTCLYEGGLYEEAEKLQEKYKAKIDNDPVCYPIKAARLIYNGEAQKGYRLLEEASSEHRNELRSWNLDYVLRWEAEYVSNNPVARRHFERQLMSRPSIRRGWVLLDQWERRERSVASHYLYETYLWLHPDDQWFARSCKAFQKDGGVPEPQVDAQGLLDILDRAKSMQPADVMPTLYGAGVRPLMIEWTVKKLLDAGDRGTAERIAQAYCDLDPSAGASSFRAWRHWILRLATKTDRAQ